MIKMMFGLAACACAWRPKPTPAKAREPAALAWTNRRRVVALLRCDMCSPVADLGLVCLMTLTFSTMSKLQEIGRPLRAPCAERSAALPLSSIIGAYGSQRQQKKACRLTGFKIPTPPNARRSHPLSSNRCKPRA
jgi:hypothetical protein